ncbi:MAG: Xaa-Pro peptidase family protein [Planctomycetota bacterium]
MTQCSTATLAALCALLAAPALAGQQAASPTKVAGARPPELGKEFHAGRRKQLMKEIGGGVILLRGGPETRSNTPFVQEHNFYYLTGVRDPGCELLLIPATGEEILFVPPYNRMKAQWDGDTLRAGEEGVERTGIARVEASTTMQEGSTWFAEVAKALERCGDRKELWIVEAPEEHSASSPDYTGGYVRRQKRDLLDGRGDRADAFKAALERRFGEQAEVKDLTRTLYAMRTIKTPEEVQLLGYTARVACTGIAEAIKAAEEGQQEHELASIADYTFRRHGAQAIGYSPIVGSGPNGCVLHYWRNDRVMKDGDLVVMDFAPEINGYTADVTRTFPVGGKFTKAGRKLVQDVWDAQQAIIAAVKPGASFGDLSRIGSQLLVERGYKPGVHILHGPCHHLGMAVHDPSGGARRLEAGMYITVEPGAYLVEEGMGCRIEDCVLVTEDGCEVLSKGCPSHPDEIEKLAREKGLTAPPTGAGGLDKLGGKAGRGGRL